MTVYDFCDLCIDDGYPIEVWDNRVEDTVAVGTIHEVMNGDYADYEVIAFDAPYNGVLCLNIDTSDD